MGFLGSYFLEINAPSPGERKIVFPKLKCNHWVSHFEFEETLEDEHFYIGRFYISLSEDYYFFLLNENNLLTKANPKYSFEQLLTKEEYETLPIAVYLDQFYNRPHVFKNSGWEETINPIHLKTLNDALLREIARKKSVR